MLLYTIYWVFVLVIIIRAPLATIKKNCTKGDDYLMGYRNTLGLGFTAPTGPTTGGGNECEQDGQSSYSDAIRQIIDTGSITVEKNGHFIHCMTVIGQIEGHYILPSQNKTTKYEHVIPQLVAIEESDSIDGLLIILNTVGGDIEAGLAIAELISGMKTSTVSLVLGGGHSIGVPLAVSAKKSFIVPSATMTIHPVRMNGLVLGVPQTLSYFEQMQERIVHFVSKNSNMPADKFRSLMLATGELVMDVGTVLDGKEAVKGGLIDSLGSLSNALNCLDKMILEKEKAHKKRSKEKSKNKQKDDV